MSAPLPSWIARLLGIQTESGEGSVWRLEQSWDWPSSLKLVAVVLLAVFVVGTYLKEGRRASRRFRMVLAAIRLIAVGILLVMLAQVTLLVQPTSLPYVAVLVDDSLSMAHPDRYEDKLRQTLQERIRKAGFDRPDRWTLACTLLSEDGGALLAELLERYKLRLYYLTGPRLSTADSVDKTVAELHATRPSGKTTRLGAGVRTVLEDLGGSTPAAIVLLTDGINTEGPPLSDGALDAARKGVPLYLVGLGDDRPERDVKLSDLLVDDEVFVDDVVYFEAEISSVGYRGRQAQVVLRRQGREEVLARATVTLGPDGQSQQIRLAHRPTQEGEFTYVLEVEPLEGESQTENNRLERTVRVRKETIRVLLVYADPSYEFRYLSRMLERDKTIQLSVVLQNADPRHFEQDRFVLKDGFPAKADDLSRYDVIILGDASREAMLPSMIQNLADFVEQPKKGGALIVIAGPRHMPLGWRNTPLERLLPIELATARLPDPDRPLGEGFTVRPTELGLASPGMYLGETPEASGEVWTRLPPLHWLLEAPDLKRGARVLAATIPGMVPDRPALPSGEGRDHPTDGARPVILMQYVGAGKVLFHATDETWLWRYRVGDVYFARYWVQTIRYLARSKLKQGDRTVKLVTDQREYRRGEPVRLWVRFADERQAPGKEDGVSVTLEHKGHQTRQIQLHRSLTGGGVFESVANDLGAGSYHAFLATPPLPGEAPWANFEVAAVKEDEQLQMDSQAMQGAAKQTKGQFYTIRTADRLLDDLPAGYRAPVDVPQQRPLWNSPALMAAFLGLLIGEWVLRKLGGMV